MKRMLIGLFIAATALSPVPSLAAATTTQLAIKDGAAASQNLNVTSIGGNFLSQINLCDPITVNTCAPISATTGLTVNGTVAATQSGTWNIGTVTALATVTNPIGIKGADGSAISSNSNPVPVSIQSGASSGTEYTEDAGAASNPVAGGLICVRRDTLSTSEVSADGDNVACKAASTGAIVVIASDVNGTKADFTSPSTVTGSGSAGTAATGVVTVQGIASMTPLLATLSGTNTVATVTALTGGSTAHDGAGGSINPVAIGGYASAAAPSDVSADADIVRAWNLRNGARAVVLTAAGALIPGDATSGLRVGGGVAHDGADAGNPLKIGGRAVNAEIAAVANNDRTDFVADLTGKQIVLPYANPENFVSGVITSAMTGTTSTSLVAAPASGLRNYLTQITCSNGHATVGTDIIVQDGNGGTTYYLLPAAAVYGGAVLTFPTPLRQPTTATAVYVADVTTGASVKCAASGYKGA